MYLLGAVIGLMFVVLGVPMWRRRVAPNGFAGFRTAATLRDEGLWYEVNAALGRDYVLAGLGIVVVQLACWMLGAPRTAVYAAGGAVLAIPLLVAAHGLWLTRDRPA